MGNRFKVRLPKAKAKRCPKCRERRMSSKEYDDATLYVCPRCKFPIRVAKG